MSYVRELKPLLRKGTGVERRNFIQSFVNKIAVNYPEVEIQYTVPLKKGELHDREWFLPEATSCSI